MWCQSLCGVRLPMRAMVTCAGNALCMAVDSRTGCGVMWLSRVVSCGCGLRCHGSYGARVSQVAAQGLQCVINLWPMGMRSAVPSVVVVCMFCNCVGAMSHAAGERVASGCGGYCAGVCRCVAVICDQGGRRR